MTTKEQWPPNSGLPEKKRFKKATKLKWGETPFDDLSRAELLRLVQAYHSAVASSQSVMAVQAEGFPSRYWMHGGSGGRALAKCNERLRLFHRDMADGYYLADDRGFECPSVTTPDRGPLMPATYEMLTAQVALLKECHDACDQALRSAVSIAERDGKDTNWAAHRAQLREALDYYHAARAAFSAAHNNS